MYINCYTIVNGKYITHSIQYIPNKLMVLVTLVHLFVEIEGWLLLCTTQLRCVINNCN